MSLVRNRARKSQLIDVGITHALNAASQQLSFGSQTSTYDLNGNLVSDGDNTYTWDARNQLATMTGPAVNASFQYNAAGTRTSKIVNGTTTSFLYDGANIVQEQSAQTGNANLLNGGVDEIFLRTDASGAFSPLTDALGSSLSLTDASGTAQTAYTYGAFGQPATTGSVSSNASQFTNRENDGTGLQYNRARYYSPTLQRFISEDPLGFGGGDINIYAYTANSPTNFTDPSGMEVLPASVYEKPMLAGRQCGLEGLGFFANVAAGFGAKMGNLLFSPSIVFPGLNPVTALLNLTPGGGAVDPSSGPYHVGEVFGIVHTIALGAAAGGGGAAEGSTPNFLGQAEGPAIPIPEGATGPIATRAPGIQYTGGSGGNGLSPAVNNVRIMDPNAANPTGYVNYGKTLQNGSWQTVNPYTGSSVSKSSSWWHILLGN